MAFSLASSLSTALLRMARRLKGKARPETPEERAARIAAQKEAEEKFRPLVYATLAVAVAAVVFYFKAIGA